MTIVGPGSSSSPDAAPPSTRAPRPIWYLLGGVVLITFAGVVLFAGDRLRWGWAKGITLAAVGLGQLAIAQLLRTSAQEGAPADQGSRLSPLAWARLATTVAWIAWIVVWVAERLTR